MKHNVKHVTFNAAKHTPGPWVASLCLTEVDRGVPGFTVVAPGRTPPLIVARARCDDADLIAAAPDLLAACISAVRELNEIRARDGVPYTHQGFQASVTPESFSAVVDQCFAAITKAQGAR